jgi:MFS family permease
MVFFGFMGVLGWGLTGWLPTYFGERFHLSQGRAGLAATGFLNSGSFIGVLLGGVLADLASRRDPRGRIWVPAGGLLIAAGGVLMLSLANVMWVAVAGVMLYGITRAFSDSNMMPILCLVADRRYRGTGYGLLNFISCAIGGFGNYAAGAMRDAHIDLSRIFLGMVGVILFCALVLFRVKPARRVLSAASQSA